MNINLPNGKTVSVPAERYFALSEEEIQEFFESCMADDLGEFVNDPFNGTGMKRRIVIDETPDLPEEEVEEDPTQE